MLATAISDRRAASTHRRWQSHTMALAGFSFVIHVAAGIGAILAVNPALIVDEAVPSLQVVFETEHAVAAPAPAPRVASEEIPPLSTTALPEMPNESAPPASNSVAAESAALPAPRTTPSPVAELAQPSAAAARPSVAARSLRRLTPATPRPPAALAKSTQTQAPSATPEPAAAPSPAVDGAWRGALAAWVLSRKRYPDYARNSGVEGDVAVRFTISRDGQVLDAQLVRGSGSDLLDQAALSMFRGGRAPAFPPGMAQQQITSSVSIRYRLQQ